ncbi:MAG: hypothetical protein AAF958_14665 [Planctomycetota bacterium]
MPDVLESQPDPIDRPAISDAGQPWMKPVLLCAAVYNLIFGAWVIFRPGDLFLWTGIDPPRYAGLWQCVGMIVGVYGIGYAIAAYNPIRHWPIVLVGFLGKTFGPIGMVFNVLQPESSAGRFPASWLWLNVTNDLIWWPFFAAILWHAAKTMNHTAAGHAPRPLDVLLESVRSQNGKTLGELSEGDGVMVLLVRHAGCTFCREALSDLAIVKAAIQSKRRLAIVHMGPEDDATANYFAGQGVGEVDRFSDPQCEVYRGLGIGRGRVTELFGPTVWWRGFLAAIIRGHGVGKLGGDGFRMGGLALIQNRKIVAAKPNTSAADRPDYAAFALGS